MKAVKKEQKHQYPTYTSRKRTETRKRREITENNTLQKNDTANRCAKREEYCMELYEEACLCVCVRQSGWSQDETLQLVMGDGAKLEL